MFSTYIESVELTVFHEPSPNSFYLHSNSWFWYLSIPYDSSLSAFPRTLLFYHLHFFIFFFFLNFTVEFANSTRSPLATSNPKTRWDFFTPPGKHLRSSRSSRFHPQVLNAVSLLILQALGSTPLVPTLVFHLTLFSVCNETHLTPQCVCHTLDILNDIILIRMKSDESFQKIQ